MFLDVKFVLVVGKIHMHMTDVNRRLVAVVVVLFLGGPVGCNSDEGSRDTRTEPDKRNEQVLTGSTGAKYLPVLDELLPRYYELLGIDDRKSDTSWSKAVDDFRRRKISFNVHATMERSVIGIETVIQRRLASHAASPSNTLFMPVNLLMAMIRAYGTSDDSRKFCPPSDPCRFARQIFSRFARDIAVCIESQKHTRPSTDYYRFYRGLVDYFKVSLGIEESAARVKGIYFLDTYVLPIYISDASTSISSYRWTPSTYAKYPRDLMVIEEFIANGPGNSEYPKSAVDIFNRFINYASSFWDKRVIMDTEKVYRTREILITIKSITTDIRHLR